MAERDFYIGIDIDDVYAVTSFFSADMKEPATISMVAGSEIFQIPVQIARKKESGQWLIGENREWAEEEQVTVIDALFSKAINEEELFIEEESYMAEELLLIFLRKLIG